MQVALNILLFFAGFMIATLIALRPKKARQDVERLASNVRYVANGFEEKAQDSSKREPGLESNDRYIPADGSNLLSK